MMAFILAYGFNTNGGALALKAATIGESRTLGYQIHGAGGWFTIFIGGMLCNCMVSMGAMISTSAGNKVAAAM